MSSISRTNFGTLGQIAKRKLRNDNDIKIIIQGANSQTGIGKTTLAIQLCRFIDDTWNAEQKSFIDIQDYLEFCISCEKGSAVLIDEIEAGADSRRAMSSDNVDLSHGWATLRARNLAHVATLPSISMLDKRMLELADFWILVKRRGIAQPFQVNVNNFNPSKLPQRKPFPGDEHIKFRDIPSNDQDKRYLDEIKDEMIKSDGTSKIPKAEHEREIKRAKRQARKEKRNEAIKEIYEITDLSTTELSELDFVGVSQGQVSNIINS